MNANSEVVRISGIQIHHEHLVIQHELQLIKVDWKLVECIKSKPMLNCYRISVKFTDYKMIVNTSFNESVAINNALEKCVFLAKTSKVKKALKCSSSNVYTPKLTHLADLIRKNLEKGHNASASTGSLMNAIDSSFKAPLELVQPQEIQLLGLEIQHDRVMYCLQGRSYYEPLSWSLVKTLTIKGGSPTVILALQNGQILLSHGSGYNQIVRTCKACHFLHDSNKVSRVLRLTSDTVYVVKDVDQTDMTMVTIGGDEVVGLIVHPDQLVLRNPRTREILKKITWENVLYIKKKKYSKDLSQMVIKLVDNQKVRFVQEHDVVKRFLRVAESLTTGKKGGFADRILHKANKMYKFEVKDNSLPGSDEDKRNSEDGEMQPEDKEDD